jgi:Questin oxidase-like
VKHLLQNLTRMRLLRGTPRQILQSRTIPFTFATKNSQLKIQLIRKMATASHLELSENDTGVFRGPRINSESARTASQLLQENHDKYHIFFNHDSFHNHIAHHILTIYALGATKQEIQKAYDMNKDYQRLQYPVDSGVVQDMSDKATFAKYLGQEKYFSDYEAFFQKEIEANGWQAVLNEHLFSRDEHADALLVRMYAGFLHPIIHLGFGVEFKQPAILAEALAQAAVHDHWIGDLLLPAEKMATEKRSDKSLFDLIKEIQANEKIINAPHWEDGNKIRDGLLARAPDEMIDLTSQWKVKADELEKKTAEMISAAAYFTGSAQNPPKQVKFDFYFIHCTNSSIFFSSFLKQDWLSTCNKIRLLEWKGRLDLALYASRKSPKLMINEITDYSPKQPGDWEQIFKRVDRHEDDGHAAKFIRALAHGQEACAPFEEKELWPIQGKSWLRLAHMVIDSVEDDGNHWVTSAGFPQAWEGFHDRAKL